MDFWQIVMTPFSWLLKQFCIIFNNYAVALFVFALVVKIILAPFQFKGKKSMIKMNLVSASSGRSRSAAATTRTAITARFRNSIPKTTSIP